MGKKHNVAVVGVGAVGIEMLRCLKQRNFPVGDLKVFARSAREIDVDGDKYSVEAISPEGFEGINIALFAGTEGEKGAAVTYAPEAIKRGVVVIDNGADFRLDPEVPLVVPEVNPEDVKQHNGLIANPNCATIQMVVALAPIHKKVGLKRVIVSSYQAASGAGRAAADELLSQSKDILEGREAHPKAMPKQIAFNVFPHIGGFGELGYTSEEWKTVRETHKILHDDTIKISATTVRVPVVTGHSESVYIRCKHKIKIDDIRKLLKESPGIKVIDDPSKGLYPTAIDGAGIDDVLVGRIRQDAFNDNALWLWIVSDNLRKGAALNAVQIAELL
ncbi:MAG: aspartate-semialdehyde dehydrogenase [Candidatus Omnitrophica bacterium]|nr:aspartate-semialdehyde dehydrogenase [Candidatus Omnitrophota bacterium]